MRKQEFLNLLEEEVLEIDPGTLNGSERLSHLEEWDSMAAMSFIAMVDEQFGFTLSAKRLAESETVEDLVALLGDKITM